MSHAAEVAVEVADGSYNVFYSHNGAFQDQLREVLQENKRGLRHEEDPSLEIFHKSQKSMTRL